MNLATGIICLVLVVIIIFAIKSYMRRMSTGCCGGTAQPSVKKIKVKDKNPANYKYSCTLKIDGMSCAACAARVENALNTMDGVWARVDLMKGQAQVLMKSKISADRCEYSQMLKKAGYDVYKVIPA